MKKLILLICLINAISGELYADHKNSILNLRFSENGLFTVTLDGHVYGTTYKNFRTENLKPGRHLLKVVKHNNNYRHYNSAPRIIFHEYVNIEPSCELFAMIDRFQNFQVYKIIKLYESFENNCRFGCINACIHNSEYDDYNYENNVFDNAPHCMNSIEFNNLKLIIQSKWFDSSRKQIAVQVIASNLLTSMQIRELLLLFDFESTRLEFAKFAYNHAADPQNFYLIYDAFDFESSVHTLNTSIAFKN